MINLFNNWKIVSNEELEQIKSDYKDQIDSLSADKFSLVSSNMELDKLNKVKEIQLEDLQERNEELQEENKELSEKINYISPIEKTLQKYTQIPNIAYKKKRKDDTIVFVNQLITPDSFEIEHLRQTMNLQEATHDNFIKFANFICKYVLWIDEQTDNYAYPEEVLSIIRTLKNVVRDDCDTVTDIFCSMFPNNSCKNFGYYVTDDNKKIGHSFVKFINENGKEMFLELTWANPETFEITDKHFVPYIAFTKDKTYEIKSGLRFGKEPTFSWYKNRTI